MDAYGVRKIMKIRQIFGLSVVLWRKYSLSDVVRLPDEDIVTGCRAEIDKKRKTVLLWTHLLVTNG